MRFPGIFSPILALAILLPSVSKALPLHAVLGHRQKPLGVIWVPGKVFGPRDRNNHRSFLLGSGTLPKIQIGESEKCGLYDPDKYIDIKNNPDDLTAGRITADSWASSDDSIISFDPKDPGRLKANGVGTAQITASYHVFDAKNNAVAYQVTNSLTVIPGRRILVFPAGTPSIIQGPPGTPVQYAKTSKDSASLDVGGIASFRADLVVKKPDNYSTISSDGPNEVVEKLNRDLPVALESSNPAVATVSSDGIKPSATLTAKGSQPFYVHAISDGVSYINISGAGLTNSLQITVVDGSVILPSTSVSLNDGDTLALPCKLLSKANNPVANHSIVVQSDKNTLAISGSNQFISDGEGKFTVCLNGHASGDAHLSFLVQSQSKPQQFTVTVRPKVDRYISDKADYDIVVGDTAKIPLKLLDRHGLLIDNTTTPATIPESISGDSELANFMFDSADLRQLLITGLKCGKGQVCIHSNPATQTSDHPLKLAVTVKPQLGVAMDDVDDKMAEDLFGRQTAGEYYVKKIILTNNLNLAQSSPLALRPMTIFGDAIRVKVNVKRAGPSQAAKIQAETMGVPPPGGNDPDTTELPLVIHPYAFEEMNSTLTSRKNRDPLNVFLRYTNIFFGVFAFGNSLLAHTSLWPHPGVTAGQNLALFQNGVFTTFQNDQIAVRDAQGQGLQDYALRSSQTLNAGQSLTKYIFIPKSPLQGVIPDKSKNQGSQPNPGTSKGLQAKFVITSVSKQNIDVLYTVQSASQTSGGTATSGN